MNTFSKSDIQTVYEARKNRLVHPNGKSDNGGRWYPSEDENADNYTDRLRSPSRSWPWSYMTGARTRKHVAALAEANPAYFAKLLEEAKAKLAQQAN